MFYHITHYEQAKNSTLLLEAAKQIAKSSVEGLSSEQTKNIMLGVVNISSDPAKIQEVTEVIRENTLAQVYPEERPTEFSSENFDVTMQRTTPKGLISKYIRIPSSQVSVTLATAEMLQQMGFSENDDGTMIDTVLTEYPKLTSEGGA